jgi:hypothetical protein
MLLNRKIQIYLLGCYAVSNGKYKYSLKISLLFW